MNKLFVVVMALTPVLSGYTPDEIRRNAAIILGEIDSAEYMFPQCTKLFAPLKQSISPLYHETYCIVRSSSAKASCSNASIVAEQLKAHLKNEQKAGYALLAITHNSIKEKYEELVFTAKQAYDTYQFKTPKPKL